MNTEWKADFKRNFVAVVVEKCSKATKEAITNDEDIKVGEALPKYKYLCSLNCHQYGGGCCSNCLLI